ncbi:hypothetical protein AVEN_194663-1 [Araneus ventricosus]|uniref:Uncharacterized protein n=1 Tax=Araneus ventricosus TaxID=182803 RepID=A0A4Y2A735_ARAVE|nr:hypothetical protein AVEN_194663-1 [Araneus ventricosus]
MGILVSNRVSNRLEFGNVRTPARNDVNDPKVTLPTWQRVSYEIKLLKRSWRKRFDRDPKPSLDIFKRGQFPNLWGERYETNTGTSVPTGIFQRYPSRVPISMGTLVWNRVPNRLKFEKHFRANGKVN